MSVADRVTVLYDGATMGTYDIGKCDRKTIFTAMTNGANVGPVLKVNYSQSSQDGKVILEARGISAPYGVKRADINVIVVSGYGEFEYAKAALNYGAYSYLLKPVDRDELSDILSKLRDKILNEEEGKAERQERIRRDCETRRQRLLQDIADGVLENNVNLRDINAKYCTGFCEDKYSRLYRAYSSR